MILAGLTSALRTAVGQSFPLTDSGHSPEGPLFGKVRNKLKFSVIRGNADKPIIWVLLGQKHGDNAQLRNLAGLLGYPYLEKHLKFNRLSCLPSILLGPSMFSVSAGSSPLEPPWPDAIITFGKRSVPAALWVKKRSGGRTKLIHMGRPWAPLVWFDLIITTPQYRLPNRPNVVQNGLPIVSFDQHQLHAETEKWSETFENLPRPWTALLVGGASSTFSFGAQTAKALGKAASLIAKGTEGSLFVTASRRCSLPSFNALVGEIKCPNHIHNPHDSSKENPYLAYLNCADRFVVTCDSASMIAEACLMGKPVHIFDLPAKYEPVRRMTSYFKKICIKMNDIGSNHWTKLYDFMFNCGILTPARDMGLFHDRLRKMGLIDNFPRDHDSVRQYFSNMKEITDTCDKIRALLEKQVN
jgi:mitochondrial fission protein ELM1